MTQSPLHYHYQLTLQSSPAALWPYVADTDRLNRDVGLSPITRVAEADVVNGRKTAQQTIQGFWVQQWTEEPFQWVRPYTYHTERKYTQGLFHTIRQQLHMAETTDGGTTLDYEIWVTPRSGPLRRLIDGSFSKMDFPGVFRAYDAEAQAHQGDNGPAAALVTSPLLLERQIAFVEGGETRLGQMQPALVNAGTVPEIAERLVNYLRRADDLTAAVIRPYELADLWHEPRRDVLDACLIGTRVGLLDMRWDLLCPLCRGVKASADHLADITQEVHCEVCHIDYTANFEQSVELTFYPNAQIREITDAAYCVGGPENTPHIEMQQLLQPGATRVIQGDLPPGRYRARALNLRGNQYFRVRNGADDRLAIRASQLDEWPTDEPYVRPQAAFTLVNSTDDEQLFVLEHLAWSDQSVTAADVTTQQVFRDLFSSEALRPREQIAVSSLTFVFTDLRASTQMYQEMGDAPAFGLVMDHFTILREVISEEEGAIVKTIGDAVMAVFRQPERAVRAMVRAHSKLAQPGSLKHPIQLRVGIHTGKAIAVTLNERLDYFGTTVNIAARLEGQSNGADVVISEAVYVDPNVQALLNGVGTNLNVESYQTKLKGFSEKDFMLWRLTPDAALQTTEIPEVL
jgi:adenylate cyclase